MSGEDKKWLKRMRKEHRSIEYERERDEWARQVGERAGEGKERG